VSVLFAHLISLARWENSLRQLAEGLEDWVCETRFVWAEQRHAVVPGLATATPRSIAEYRSPDMVSWIM